jgi:hypothetical protein
MASFPPKPRGCGCLALFCVLCLSAFTAAEGAVLYWCDPNWIDRVAFWKPAPFEPDVIFSADPADRAALAETDDPLPISPKRETLTSDRIRLIGERSVQADYDPANGATVTTREGAVLQFPPGAILAATKVRVTPIASLPDRYLDKNLAIAGPFYKLFVGDKEHYRFAVPIRVTMPYSPDLLGKDGSIKGLAIYVSDGGPWQQCASAVDEKAHTVTAPVSHCSGIACVLGGVATLGPPAIALWTNATTTRGLFSRYFVRGRRRDTYDTENFSIYYTTSGDDAVPPDAGPQAFPLDPKKADPTHPKFVVLIGEYLEEILPDLAGVGMPIPAAHLRHDIFLEPNTAFGDTDYGGPITITTNWRTPSGAYPDKKLLSAEVRATLAHELIHVAQSQYYSAYAMWNGRWWMEETAAYLADRFWEKKNDPTNVVRDYYLRQTDGKLLQYSLTQTAASDPNYAYAAFLRWLEQKGDVNAVVNRVNAGGNPTPEAFDAALQSLLHQSLADLLHEFARAYCHDDLWHGEITPQSFFNDSARTQARMQTTAPDDFTFLTRLSQRAGGATRGVSSVGGVINVAAHFQAEPLPPLSSLALPVLVDHLPEYRKGKLVVDVLGGNVSDPDLAISVAASSVGPSLPTAGKRGDFTRIQRPIGPAAPGAKSPFMVVLDGLVAPDGVDRVTLVVTNRSFTRTIPAPDVLRWALLPPEGVSFSRVGWFQNNPDPKLIPSGNWDVFWSRSELAKAELPFGQNMPLFGGYNLYRRKAGDKDFPAAPTRLLQQDDLHPEVEAATDESAVDKAPDLEDYVYTISVRDVFGNESEKAMVDGGDPFQGAWEGKVYLVQGSLEKPTMDLFKRYLKSEEKQERDAEKAEKDPNRQAEMRRAWDEDQKVLTDIQNTLQSLLTTGEWFARLGVPAKFEIRRTEGQYFLGLSEIAGLQTGMKVDTPLEKRGPHTLGFRTEMTMGPEPPPPKGVPPLFIRLYRPDEIRDEYVIDDTVGDQRLYYRIKWAFKRVKKE